MALEADKTKSEKAKDKKDKRPASYALLSKDKTYICITNEFYFGPAFSSIATQLVNQTGLDVLVFGGSDKDNTLRDFLKDRRKDRQIIIDIISKGI